MDEDLLKTIEEKVGEPVVQRPKDFGITIKEYSELKNISDTQARKILEKAVRINVLGKKIMKTGLHSSSFVYYKLL